MATFRNRNGKRQARVQIKGHTMRSKTFINKVDAERPTPFGVYAVRPNRPRKINFYDAHYEFK